MNIKSALVHPLLKSLAPLIIGSSYHILKQISFLKRSNLNLYNSETNQKLHFGSSQPDGVISEEMSSSGDFLTLLNQVSFGIYENFFAFLLVMLLIEIICKIAQIGYQGFWKELKTLIVSMNKGLDDCKRKSQLFNVILENQMMIRIFSYALIFVSFQIVGFCLSFALTPEIMRNSQIEEKFSSMKMVNQQYQEDYFGLPRILSEEQEIQNTESALMTSDKISLSMRNVLSSLNINVNAMVLSKDRKIAYVTVDLYGFLKIVDVSDLKAPFVVSSLSLKSSSQGYRIKSLLLSSDERTLYASNSRELEIIDVRDPDSPKLISFTNSEIFSDDFQFEISGFFQTSLTVSERTKTLYIGGLGLQVYDVSDLKNPVLLKAVKKSKHEDPSEGFLKNEICLSRDGQVLFIANGTLDVYNTSNPRDMNKIDSFKVESEARSLLLSEDGKTIFLLGSDEDGLMIFEEVESLNYDSLKVRKTIHLGKKSLNSPRFLTLSPSKSKFFIYANSESYGNNITLFVFDYLKQTTIEIEKSVMEETFVMNFSPDGRTLIAAANNEFLAVELYLDYPNSRIFSESLENQISNFSLNSTCTYLRISDDGKYAFIIRRASHDVDNELFYKVFEIWDMSDSRASKILSSYGFSQDILQIKFTKNYDTAFLLGESCLTILDISNKSSILEKRTYHAKEQIRGLFEFVTSSDGEIGFLLMNNDGKGVVTFVNFSQATGIEAFVTLDQEFTLFQSHLILKDDKTLIVLDEEILIYDISNLHSPVQVASLPYGINETRPEIGSYTLSPDRQTLFVYTADRNFFTKLRIYNISDVSSPHFISEKYLSRYTDEPMPPEFSFPLHSKNGFLYQKDSLIKLNLGDLKKPAIAGIIPLKSDKIKGLAISPDGQMVYTYYRNEVRILNANIEYSLYLSKEKYLLGENYSNKISMLHRSGKSSDYDLMESQSYKIVKLSLLDMQVAPNKVSLERTVSPLPSWMAFDGESNILTVNAKRQSELGAYTLHLAFSLKIPVNVFNASIVDKNGKPMSSENLVAWLMSLDYLDSELFLTAKFRSLETFYLPDQFLDYKEQIYNILKGYYMETCTMFDVVSSLELEQEKLVVSSLSTNNIKAEITVNSKQGSDVKFVNVPYGGVLPLIRENKTKAVLEGTKGEINLALRSIVVNFENNTSSDATIVIKDGLNPPVSMELSNISKNFKANKPPKLNNNTDHQTLQEQIDNADIQTGKYFAYTLTNDIFEDEFAESLSYEMVMAKNNTAFPTWLSLSGLTVKGTPPEEIFGREIDLVLVAKNDFKQFGVPFKLQIKISAVFWVKLLSRYSPYILTLLGFLVSANKIFNIVAKRRYRHPQEYHLGPGEEISSESIFPISFVKEEKIQSELILKYFKMSWKDFIDPVAGALNKQKIIDRIHETIQEIPFKEREAINRYPSAIIEKIIVNKFVQIQLDSDKKTKSVFEELKSKCLEVVERGSTGFVIHPNKLKKLLIPFNENSNDLEESLISSISVPGVNFELLKDAILVYAFDMHSIDISPLEADITIKQHVPSRLLYSFLKLDLKDINLQDKNKIDYGINYRIIDDKLCFYGITQKYFQKKTLAVQIKNSRHKILKEIWIHGASNNLQESLLLRSERGNRGQGYEVF